MARKKASDDETMAISLEQTDFGCYLIIDEDTGDDILYQSDWDRPALASMFGWEPCPFCRATDGTVDCEHRHASAMIQSAGNFLDNHEGEISEHYWIENGILTA